MIYTCPFCLKLFEMGGDHGQEPCADCYADGHRIDSCGNRAKVPPLPRMTASPYDLTGQKEYPGE